DRDVSALFLAEAGILGLSGGVLGIALSLALGAAGNYFGRRMIEQAMLMPFEGTLFVFPWWLVTGGLAFSVGVGLVAALVPAQSLSSHPGRRPGTGPRLSGPAAAQSLSSTQSPWSSPSPSPELPSSPWSSSLFSPSDSSASVSETSGSMPLARMDWSDASRIS